MLINGAEAPWITVHFLGRVHRKKHSKGLAYKNKKSNHQTHLHTCTNQLSNTYINKHGMYA